MRFWDSSALLPLFVVEQTSPRMRDLIAIDDEIVVRTLTIVELLSAVWRRESSLRGDDRRAAAALVTAANVEWAKGDRHSHHHGDRDERRREASTAAHR